MGKEWLEVFKQKAKVVSKKTSENVNYFVSIKKTQMEILKVNHEINKIYKVIGEIIYMANQQKVEAVGVDTLCAQIDAKNGYITQLERRIEMIKESKKMSEIGVKYDGNVPEFINNPINDNEVAVMKFCPNCNTGNELSNEKCKECGTKLN